ncbi:MAG: MFS transporter [Candidatus Pelagibacterales bacterium]|jgi:FSR family fosmidomycin resistance protein-like MFS transporter|nr:hypothetical protein [Actinomycetota bacterium]GIR05002.1 MAG: MFS transporter [Pelagibacterales bacterium]|tara:strand:- start:60 stop:1250 length:1191 start_codon:yes stop_codon:yes gene_type:complete
MENDSKLTVTYAALGHLLMHMFAAFYFVIVLAIEDDWKLSYDELLNLWFLGSLLVGLGALPAGWISDRWSRSGMIAIMFIGLGISSLLCGLSGNKVSLFISLSLLGLFCAIYHPAGISWVVNTSKETGKALGFNNIFGGVGIGLGAFFAGVLIEQFNWQAAFMLPGLISLVVGLSLTYHLKSGKISLKNISSEQFKDNPEKNQMLKIAIIMLLSITCLSFVYQILQTSLPKAIDIRLTDSLDLSTSDIGYIVAAIYIVSGLMNYVGGILTDKYSEKLIYSIGIVGQGLLLLLIVSLSNYWLIAISLAIVAFNSSILPAENLLLAKFSPEKYQSLVYGIKFIVSFTVGPIALIMISRSYDLTGEFGVLYLAFGFVMIIMFLIVLTLPVKKVITGTAG